MKERVELSRRNFLKTVLGIGSLSMFALERCKTEKPQPEQEGYPGVPVGSTPAFWDKYPKEYREEIVPSTCWIGKQECSLYYRVIIQNVNGKEIRRPVKVEGLIWKDEGLYNPRNVGTLCPKGASANITALYDYHRVKYPLKRINPKGQPGRFIKISWDEALEIIKEKLLEAKAKGYYVLWQKGRSKSSALYDNAFTGALKEGGWKVYKMGHGSHCSDALYRAAEYTAGESAGLNPDFKHARYVIDVGTGLITSGGNKYCFIYWQRQINEARERGVLKKVVTLNPTRLSAGRMADEWIPIKPQRDLAFFLGIIHYLLKYELIDKEYLKKYTNASFLVISDGDNKGYFLRDANGKELVWDSAQGKVVPYDQAVNPELFYEGTVIIDEGRVRKQVGSELKLESISGQIKVKSALQVLRDTVRDRTPEWADRECDIPAGTTARIARELYENSGIEGNLKITIDGVELPLRPVAFSFYHAAQIENGFQMSRAILIIAMLLGSLGVPGGTMISPAGKIHDNFGKFENLIIKDKPDFTLSGSKFFPIASPNPAFLSNVLISPEKYGVDSKVLPKVVFAHYVNLAGSFLDIPLILQAWQKIDFICLLSPWLSETAYYLADIVLPIATAEKYEGPISGSVPYESVSALRIPPISWMWESKSELTTYIEICERVGILYGDKGYIAQINKELKLGDYKLDVNKKPTDEEIFDQWAKSIGKDLNYFKTKGVTEIKKKKVSEIYSISLWGKERMRIYGEALKRMQDVMKKKGADEIFWRDYTPVPMWRKPTMEDSPADYKYYLVSGKRIEAKQSRTAFIPILSELLTGQEVVMNTFSAKLNGLQDGDEVWVESHNAITQETRRLKTKLRTSEAIRPDTVLMWHHYGLTVDPRSRVKGPTPNFLFFATPGYVQCTQDATFHVKVKIYKA